MSFHRWTRFLSTVPWFIDKSHAPKALIPKPATGPSVPDHAPQILKLLHSQLLQSPHLDTSVLSVGPSVPPPPGPPLPMLLPHGRRNRGGTFSGESAYDMLDGGLWSWVVLAQVSIFLIKKSTFAHGLSKGERRHRKKRFNRICRTCYSKNGEYSFCRDIPSRSSARVQFLSHEPPFLLPPKSRRQAETGWVMIDAGPFAIHVLSKEAREKYFNHQTEW